MKTTAITKHIPASSFGKSGLALALGAALLAATMPAQAQWLVQDNNLYNLVNDGVVEKIAVSGDGKGSFRSSTKNNLKNSVTSALGLGNTKSFDELSFDTENLLDKNKEDSDLTLEAMKKASSAVGSVGGNVIGNAIGNITGSNTYAIDAANFFGSSIPGCNTHTNKDAFKQCMHMRNILGSQLKEIQTISKTLEDRNLSLQGIMAERYKTPGELQKKQYEISVLQAVIANDQMRLQAALASYQAMRDLYKEKYNEALNVRQQGKGDLKTQALRLAGAAAGTATFAASKAALDSQVKPQIFKKR